MSFECFHFFRKVLQLCLQCFILIQQNITFDLCPCLLFPVLIEIVDNSNSIPKSLQVLQISQTFSEWFIISFLQFKQFFKVRIFLLFFCYFHQFAIILFNNIIAILDLTDLEIFIISEWCFNKEIISERMYFLSKLFNLFLDISSLCHLLWQYLGLNIDHFVISLNETRMHIINNLEWIFFSFLLQCNLMFLQCLYHIFDSLNNSAHCWLYIFDYRVDLHDLHQQLFVVHVGFIIQIFFDSFVGR